MTISKKALEEYKDIRKEDTGEDISDEVALDEATNLLNLVEAVYKPLKKEMVEKKDVE